MRRKELSLVEKRVFSIFTVANRAGDQDPFHRTSVNHRGDPIDQSRTADDHLPAVVLHRRQHCRRQTRDTVRTPLLCLMDQPANRAGVLSPVCFLLKIGKRMIIALQPRDLTVHRDHAINSLFQRCIHIACLHFYCRRPIAARHSSCLELPRTSVSSQFADVQISYIFYISCSILSI